MVPEAVRETTISIRQRRNTAIPLLFMTSRQQNHTSPAASKGLELSMFMLKT